MPLYEYLCQDCGITFEARQKFSDPPLSQCRSCGGAVRKLISQAGFTLKGGGWYQQGYTESTKPAACAGGGGGKEGGCAGCPKAASD